MYSTDPAEWTHGMKRDWQYDDMQAEYIDRCGMQIDTKEASAIQTEKKTKKIGSGSNYLVKYGNFE